MSDYERNKGLLKPATDSIESIAESAITELSAYYTTKEEQFIDNAEEYGYVFIAGKLFTVEFEDTDNDPEMCEVKNNDDGTISFHTYHYNGGAHWTELLEGKV